MICYMACLTYTQTAKCYMKSASSKAGGICYMMLYDVIWCYMICYMARLNYTQTAKCYMKSASSKAGRAFKYPNMPILSIQV